MSRVTSSAASGRKRRSSMKRAAAYFVRFASRNATRLRRADGVEKNVDGTPRPHSPRGVRAVTRSWTASCASEATTTVAIVGYSATSVSTAAAFSRMDGKPLRGTRRAGRPRERPNSRTRRRDGRGRRRSGRRAGRLRPAARPPADHAPRDAAEARVDEPGAAARPAARHRPIRRQEPPAAYGNNISRRLRGGLVASTSAPSTRRPRATAWRCGPLTARLRRRRRVVAAHAGRHG